MRTRITTLAPLMLLAVAAIGVIVWVLLTTRADEEAGGGPIVLISIDTLRADRLPAYGYKRTRTPHIDGLAADGIVFENAYSHSPQTLPSHASILTGELPFEHGVRDNVGFGVRQGQWTLPSALKEQGLGTGGFVSAYVLRKQIGLDQGFDQYDDALPAAAPDKPLGQVQRAGSDTLTAATRWIDAQPSSRFFLFFHIYEPHRPYQPPAHVKAVDPYDGEVEYSDEIVGRLLDHLRAKDLYDGATIILLSDHGEGLGDHGEDEHGIFLYRETIQVPLIVKLPDSRQRGRRVATPVQHIDLVPTILDLVEIRNGAAAGRLKPASTSMEAPTVGVSRPVLMATEQAGFSRPAAVEAGLSRPAAVEAGFSRLAAVEAGFSRLAAVEAGFSRPAAVEASFLRLAAVEAGFSRPAAPQTSRTFRGRSLVPLLTGTGDIPSAPIYSESLSPRYHFGWSELYALSDDRYRYIRAPRDELYDLANDPDELSSIATERPQVRTAMRGALDTLLSSATLTAPSEVSKEDRQKLAALGYVGTQTGALLEMDADKLPDPKDRVHVLHKYKRATDLAGARKFPEAIAAFREVLAADPEMIDVWLQLADIYYRGGMTERGVDAFKEVVKRNPKDPSGLTGAAAGLLRLGKLDEARAHAELAVDQVPAIAHEILARVAVQQGRHEIARREARLAEQADPTLPLGAFIEGAILHAQQRYAEAVPPLMDASSRLASRTLQVNDVNYLLGDSLARLDRYDEAMGYFRREIAISPAHVRARAGVAMLYRAQGQNAASEEAISDLIRAAPTREGYDVAAQLWTMFGEPRRAAAARAEAARLAR